MNLVYFVRGLQRDFNILFLYYELFFFEEVMCQFVRKLKIRKLIGDFMGLGQGRYLGCSRFRQVCLVDEFIDFSDGEQRFIF